MTPGKWKFFWYIDRVAKKARCYFKIHHALADGYHMRNCSVFRQPNNNMSIVVLTQKRRCKKTPNTKSRNKTSQ